MRNVLLWWEVGKYQDFATNALLFCTTRSSYWYKVTLGFDWDTSSGYLVHICLQSPKSLSKLLVSFLAQIFSVRLRAKLLFSVPKFLWNSASALALTKWPACPVSNNLTGLYYFRSFNVIVLNFGNNDHSKLLKKLRARVLACKT